MDIEKTAQAIEADAGHPLPELRQSLREMVNHERGRSYTPEQIALQTARACLGLSQEKFAHLIKTPVSTLRDWEQGRYSPPGCVVFLAQLAVDHTDLFREYS